MKRINGTELTNRLEELVRKGIDEALYSGIALRVMKDGETVAEVLEGVADLETGRPVTADTLFRLASMTKPVTAAAVLSAQDRGLLSLFDEVGQYLPAYNDMWVGRKEVREDGSIAFVPAEKACKKLRIHHLLSHVNGIGSAEMGYWTLDRVKDEDRQTLEAITNYMGEHLYLDFQPDSSFGYSGVAAFDVAGRIIELVSGLKFGDYIQKYLFDPMGITDITFEPTDEQWARSMNMHSRDGEGRSVTDNSLGHTTFENFPITYQSGGASLTGTLNAYSRFAEMLRLGGVDPVSGNRILSIGGVAQMQSIWPLPGTANIGPFESWGLGVRVIRDNHPTLPAGAFGWSGAYGTHFWIDPANNVTAIMMRNSRVDGGAGAAATIRFEKAVYA